VIADPVHWGSASRTGKRSRSKRGKEKKGERKRREGRKGMEEKR